MNPTLFSNVNNRRIDQNTNTSKPAENYEEIEVSYREVLTEEFASVKRQNSRQNTNQGNQTFTNKQPTSHQDDVNNMMMSIACRRPVTHFRPIMPTPPRPQNIKGDINGDGKLNQADVATLDKYTDGEDIKIKIKNADIDTDGKITKDDVKALQKFINPNIGDVNGDGKVTKADKEALKNYVNRESNGDDEFYINNADVNGDGKIDKKDVTELGKQVDNNHGPHRSRSSHSTPPASQLHPTGHTSHNFIERQPYQSWTDTVRQFQPIFISSDLNNRFGGEFIQTGTKINVIAETDTAYQVRYPTSNGEQTGWISRNAFQRPQSAQNVMHNLISEFVGKNWTNNFNNNDSMSFGFASFIFEQMSSVNNIGSIGRGSNNYKLEINANFVEMRNSNQFLTRHNARSMFNGAHIGDFVQMRRRNGEPHSAILTEVNNKGVRFLENNAPDSNGKFVYNKVNLTFYSYESLAINNSGMSLYCPKGEEV